ncbi:MAG: hypothetical protein ACOYXC_21365 [Candidatus Rifleibacteriota bacterium]
MVLGGICAFELGMMQETKKNSDQLETLFRCKNIKDENYAGICKILIKYFEMIENEPKAEKYKEIFSKLKVKDETHTFLDEIL